MEVGTDSPQEKRNRGENRASGSPEAVEPRTHVALAVPAP